jgi:hypothetical protein
MNGKNILLRLFALSVFLPPSIALALPPGSTPPAKDAPPDDTRLVPSQIELCGGNKKNARIVSKHKLFDHLVQVDNQDPKTTLSVNLLTTINWQTIMTTANPCSSVSGACKVGDAAAIGRLKQRYKDFLFDGSAYYRASNPDLSVEVYFAGDDDVNPIYCTAIDVPPAPPTPKEPQSNFRLRGVSDDLWISQQDQKFAKSSSATFNYTQNEVVPQVATTAITGAVGYDLLGNHQEYSLVPYVAANTSLTDTHLKPRVKASTNFVAAGILYSDLFHVPNWNLENQVILKAQQVDGTTMGSQVTSFQGIWAPWIFPVGILPGLNVIEPEPTEDNPSPQYTGQLLFDLRADLGFYEDRGNPLFLAQNKNYDRFGSKFGYSFIATPTDFPSYTLSVTETALYGATGGPRDLSYFDALLQVYFDTKKYLSTNLEYINGRDENTYVVTHSYKAGFAAHY